MSIPPLIPPEESGYIADKLVKAFKKIENNPFDVDAWSVLVRDAQMKSADQGRPIYEKVVTQFPTSGKYWKIYIEHEMKARNYEKVEKLFQRCLMKVLNIDLWKTYLHYIRETKGTLPSYREKMAQAYDFALDKMGMDIMSYSIWNDYIQFLMSVEAVGSYAENQRITAVRKVYQRGCINPMLNIELLWKEYCTFENNINPLIAKKMQEDRGRDYNNAKRVSKEYETNTRGLDRNIPSVPPQSTLLESQQVELWKKYISWEKSNPLRTEDHATIAKRVMFAYEQCLLCMGHHSDIWIEAAAYLEMSSRLLTEKGDQNAGKLFADEAAAMYERAISTTLKSNRLIYFAYAEFEESRNKYDKVHQIYKTLLVNKDIDPTLVYVQYMKFARRAEGIKAARVVFRQAREDARCTYHIYVHAALMEYYCTKDRNIALKIFELGLKKHGGCPEYILCYLEYMSHLNEDNNTRVLYERVLSSGQLQPEKSTEIWNKFLEFESDVGDLASIHKVEKRRKQLLGQEVEDKETIMLIDRYRYLDLLPASVAELRALGYQDVKAAPAPTGAVQEVSKSSSQPTTADEPKKPKYNYPMPDIRQMIPFKARSKPPPGAHIVEGGVFPPPPIAAHLLTMMPPPDSFTGPFVAVDKLLQQFRDLELPDAPPTTENGVDPHIKPDAGTQYSIDVSLGRKRKIDTGKDDSEDEDQSTVPPAHDIYRARQQKRVK